LFDTGQGEVGSGVIEFGRVERLLSEVFEGHEFLSLGRGQAGVRVCVGCYGEEDADQGSDYLRSYFDILVFERRIVGIFFVIVIRDRS
jgi:hypothetical protein